MVGGSLSQLLVDLEHIARCDAAGRGLTSTPSAIGRRLLMPIGQLAGAASDLCNCRDAVIVTGFFIPTGEVPAAETDGPLGAVMLADAMRRNGARVSLLTDRYCLDAVSVAAEAAGFDSALIQSAPDVVSAEWVDQFLAGRSGLESLIAIERVGPSHTLESICLSSPQTNAFVERFDRLVPVQSRDVPHNMRGKPIVDCTANLHLMFELLAHHNHPIRTIGIGDGGNEIGMGTIRWESLVERLGEDPGAVVACRIPTDWNIVAGTSNWGGQALAAGICALTGKTDWLDEWPAERQLGVLERMVELGPCVDGVTGKREPSVDGLSFEQFIRAWNEMVELVKSRNS